jgi:filamentous hemagglutinin
MEILAGEAGMASGGLAVGTGTVLALPAPRQIAARWGSGLYRETAHTGAGLISNITHVFTRHRYNPAVTGVSQFVQGTTRSQIKSLVDHALRYGNVTANGQNGWSVTYNFGRVIGTNISGGPASSIQIYVRDGLVRTAYPF